VRPAGFPNRPRTGDEFEKRTSHIIRGHVDTAESGSRKAAKAPLRPHTQKMGVPEHRQLKTEFTISFRIANSPKGNFS
jgi:hypothetical protein